MRLETNDNRSYVKIRRALKVYLLDFFYCISIVSIIRYLNAILCFIELFYPLNNAIMKLIVFILPLLLTTQLLAQNTISVPFGNGFVGDVAGNNSSSNSYYLTGGSGLGWSNIQFAQSTSSNIFVAQGNDIPGMVKITDYNGTEFSINGFIKWRTPSGGSPSTMVFQPSPGSYVLATNGFNGSSQYTITENKYIGLTKLGQTLTISPVPGTVSGNAATTGLLDALNAVLQSLPQLTVVGTTVQEVVGSADVSVSLSAASSNIVTVKFSTIDSTALSSSDYTAYAATLTFQPGETSKVIQIPITVDAISEVSEFFMVNLQNPTYAAISRSMDSVIILDETLPVEFIGMELSRTERGVLLNWSTASEFGSDYFEIQRKTGDADWISIGQEKAAGTTLMYTEYEFLDEAIQNEGVIYYRLMQFDQDGEFTVLPTLSIDYKRALAVFVFPNPAKDHFSVEFGTTDDTMVQLEVQDTYGAIVLKDEWYSNKGSQVMSYNVDELNSGVYFVSVRIDGETQQLRLVVQ